MEPDKDYIDLIKRWQAAKDRLVLLKREISDAECELKNSQNALGKWMVPEDFRRDEKIAVWFGDSLIQVECLENCNDFKITIRKRGKSLI